MTGLSTIKSRLSMSEKFLLETWERSPRQRLLIPRVHKRAMPAMWPQIRIGIGRLALLACESAQQLRIRPEFGGPPSNCRAWLSSIPLRPRIGCTIPRRCTSASLYFVVMLAQTHDRECALLIWSFRRACIQELRPVLELQHVVDVRLDAHILVHESCSLVSCDAGHWTFGKRRNRAEQQNQRQALIFRGSIRLLRPTRKEK